MLTPAYNWSAVLAAAVCVTLSTSAFSQSQQDSTSGVQPRQLHGLVGLSLHGSTYDWWHSEPGNTLLYWDRDGTYIHFFQSAFSPGPGFMIDVGGVLRRILDQLSVSATVDYSYTHHATDFPGGLYRPDVKSTATLHVGQLQLRAIWDQWRLKPFLGIAGGLTRMSLPKQDYSFNINSFDPAVLSDAWVSGLSESVRLGVLYELGPTLMLSGTLAYHVELFDRTNRFPLDSGNMPATGFSIAVGLEWWP